jgi:MFS transporter, PAT family, beta-lactamase induction signal transducer AmpG
MTIDSARSAPPPRAHPSLWIPTLYFAEGAPFFAVAALAPILYKRLGLGNDVIALYTSLLLWPWTLKPLWSPLLEMFKTKKFFVVTMELLGGLGLGLVALSLPLPGYFRYSMALLALVAFCSATHDIAADGLYISSLSTKDQAAYVGWLGAFYNVARVFCAGGLVVLAGLLESRGSTVRAWMSVFVLLGGMLVVLAFYHRLALPSGGAARESESVGQMYRRLADVFASFFKKPHIWLFLLFILLFRAGEGQVVAIGRLFLLDQRSVGGLGLSTGQVGTIYGTFGTVAFLAGSILGGYFAAGLGLKRALLPLIVIMNLPNAAYLYLSVTQPTTALPVTLAMCVEMFGYGFGFVGLTLFMMQEVAPGPYQTAHYAFATAVMNLGFQLAGAVSGKIQVAIGYQRFFVWVLLSAIPALVLSRFLPLRGEKAETARPEPRLAEGSAR